MMTTHTIQRLKTQLIADNIASWTNDHVALLQHAVVSMMEIENILSFDFTDEMWAAVAQEVPFMDGNLCQI
jgi:hypothetical protein